jgi:hypothetical protein
MGFHATRARKAVFLTLVAAVVGWALLLALRSSASSGSTEQMVDRSDAGGAPEGYRVETPVLDAPGQGREGSVPTRTSTGPHDVPGWPNGLVDEGLSIAVIGEWNGEEVVSFSTVEYRDAANRGRSSASSRYDSHDRVGSGARLATIPMRAKSVTVSALTDDGGVMVGDAAITERHRAKQEVRVRLDRVGADSDSVSTTRVKILTDTGSPADLEAIRPLVSRAFNEAGENARVHQVAVFRSDDAVVLAGAGIGEVDLLLESSGWTPWRGMLSTLEEEHTVQLTAGAPTIVQLVDAVTDVPLSGFRGDLEAPTKYRQPNDSAVYLQSAVWRLEADAAGECICPGLVQGQEKSVYLAVFEDAPAGRRCVLSGMVEVDRSVSTRLVVSVQRDGVAVTGMLHGRVEGGTRSRRERIRLLSSTFSLINSARVADDGSWRMSIPAPGAYWVYPEGNARLAEQIRLDSNAEIGPIVFDLGKPSPPDLWFDDAESDWTVTANTSVNGGGWSPYEEIRIKAGSRTPLTLPEFVVGDVMLRLSPSGISSCSITTFTRVSALRGGDAVVDLSQLVPRSMGFVLEPEGSIDWASAQAGGELELPCSAPGVFSRTFGFASVRRGESLTFPERIGKPTTVSILVRGEDQVVPIFLTTEALFQRSTLRVPMKSRLRSDFPDSVTIASIEAIESVPDPLSTVMLKPARSPSDVFWMQEGSQLVED